MTTGAACMPTLEQLRRDRGYSQEELAALTRSTERAITTMTVSRIERGKVSPNNTTRRVLAKVLGVTPSEIQWPQPAKDGSMEVEDASGAARE